MPTGRTCAATTASAVERDMYSCSAHTAGRGQTDPTCRGHRGATASEARIPPRGRDQACISIQLRWPICRIIETEFEGPEPRLPRIPLAQKFLTAKRRPLTYRTAFKTFFNRRKPKRAAGKPISRLPSRPIEPAADRQDSQLMRILS
jgi:hypothetical protein